MTLFSESATARFNMAPSLRRRVKNAGEIAKAPKARRATKASSASSKKIILGKVPQQDWEYDAVGFLILIQKE